MQSDFNECQVTIRSSTDKKTDLAKMLLNFNITGFGRFQSLNLRIYNELALNFKLVETISGDYDLTILAHFSDIENKNIKALRLDFDFDRSSSKVFTS